MIAKKKKISEENNLDFFHTDISERTVTVDIEIF